MNVIQSIKTGFTQNLGTPLKNAGKAIKSFGGSVQSVATKALDVVAPVNPVSQTRRVKIVPTAIENLLGNVFYEQHAPTSKQVLANSSNLDHARYHTLVNEVFGQLVNQCECSDKFKYEVRLIDDKQINAFCLPGGKTVITTGILDKISSRVGGDETKLKATIAFIMGHELTHANASHGAAGIAFKLVTKIVGFVAGNIVGQIVNAKASQEANEKIDNDPVLNPEQKTVKKNEVAKNARAIAEIASKLFGYLATALTYVADRAFSRGNEYEADRHSLTYLKKAGLDFEGAKITMEMFKDMHGNPGKFMRIVHEVFSTHPSPDNRLAAIEKEIQLLSQ